MKIAIMGSGGIGGYYGARLQQGGADVTFIARGEHLKAMQQSGLALEGDRAIHLPKVKATDDPSTIGPVDMVIFSVKLRDTETAARQILPIIGPDTGIISLQNGVQKDDMLAPIVGREHLLGGAAYIGVSITRPGAIRKAGTMERLAFGEFDNKVSKRAQAFLDACKAGGIKADIPADITLELWQKFVFLVAMSSATAAMRSTAGPIRSNSLTRQFVADLMDEVAAVGRAHGVPLAENYGAARISHADAMAPEMRSSMALDLELGRPLELPWLAGAVVDLGAKKNVPTPCCRAVRDILALYVDGKPA
ncbi:MAG: 2-dehydropantoate 2-reductase [Hyphomicrobiales bacterium]